jgi:hypothetical protein
MSTPETEYDPFAEPTSPAPIPGQTDLVDETLAAQADLDADRTPTGPPLPDISAPAPAADPVAEPAPVEPAWPEVQEVNGEAVTPADTPAAEPQAPGNDGFVPGPSAEPEPEAPAPAEAQADEAPAQDEAPEVVTATPVPPAEPAQAEEAPKTEPAAEGTAAEIKDARPYLIFVPADGADEFKQVGSEIGRDPENAIGRFANKNPKFKKEGQSLYAVAERHWKSKTFKTTKKTVTNFELV